MAKEFLQVDVHTLYILAELMERFWRRPSIGLANEIRQRQAAFGLTPIDRRRLQWEIKREPAVDKPKPAKRPKVAARNDPRHGLRAVK
jgi:hypothetical protein